jgi:hypothetical protein
LQDLVLEGGNADGTRLRPIPLRDVDPSHPRRYIPDFTRSRNLWRFSSSRSAYYAVG